MDIVEELFGTKDLYEILAIKKEDVTDEKKLRSAYMKAALKYHPDKADEKERETSTKKFQIISRINELFKDNELRKVYDETGTWPEDEKVEFNVSSFGRLDANAILEFKKMYQGSDEEAQDIKKFYEKGKGDIFYICDNVFFLNVLDDEDRVNSIIERLIETGEMERLTKGVKGEKARKKNMDKAKKEAKEAEELLKEKGLGGGMGDLMKAIAQRNQARGASFLDQLEKKYGGGDGAASKKGKTGKKKTDSADEGPSVKKSKSSTSTAASASNGSGRTTRSRSAMK